MSEEISSNEFPGNSYVKKVTPKKEQTTIPDEDRAKPEQVTKGEVIRKKKGFAGKIKENFAGDDARSVGSYIFFDVIIPAAKSMLADAASQGVERLLFGDSRSRARVSGGRSNYTSYNRMYDDRDRREPRSISQRGRATHNFDEIIISERGEAEEVIERLVVLIEDYGHAKVSDLYSMVGITGNYTDDRWGWNDLSAASTMRVRQGYLLDLPAPHPLR